MSQNIPTALEVYYRIVPLNNGQSTGSDGNPLPGRKYVDFGGGAVDDPAFQVGGIVVGRTIVAGGGGPFAGTPMTTPPLATSLIPVNIGGATATDTPGGGFDLVSPANEGADMHMVLQAAPAAPWVFTIGGIIDIYNQGGNTQAALVLRESATGKLTVLAITQSGLFISNWSSPTSGIVGGYNSIVWQGGNGAACPPTWLRVINDGSGMTFWGSVSGRTFTPVNGLDSSGAPVPISITDFFTVGPNQFGVGVNAQNSGGVPHAPSVGLHVSSWAVQT